jgi:TRAP-type mannitol/chloroaromatic compound transport system substrate-binding protein
MAYLVPDQFLPLVTFYVWMAMILGGVGSVGGAIVGTGVLAVITTAAAAENDRSLAEVVAHNAQSLAKLADEREVELRKFDDETLTALGKLSAEVLAEMGSKDDLSRRIHASFTEFRKAVVRWSDISERAFMNARALVAPG